MNELDNLKHLQQLGGKFVLLQDKVRINRNLYSLYDLESKGYLYDENHNLGLSLNNFPLTVIDVDNKEMSTRLHNLIIKENINCGIVETKRGHHFYFKQENGDRNRTNCPCALGFNVDVKTMGNNYIVLPWGNEKELIKPFDKDCDRVPDWLVPQKTLGKGGIGDTGSGGRNDELFKHIHRLSSSKAYDKEEVVKAIRLVNDYIFDEPLEDEELASTILREELLTELFDNTEIELGKSLDDTMIAIAKEIIEDKAEILCYEDTVYMYNYETNMYDDDTYKRMLIDRYSIIQDFKRVAINNTLKALLGEAKLDTDYINCKNGFVDRKLNLHNHVPTIYSLDRLNFSFDNECYDKHVDKFLDDVTCNNIQRRLFLLEMIGSAMYGDLKEQVCFFLYGATARNGKSTFLDMVRCLIPQNSSWGFADLQKPFNLAGLQGKLVNLSGETPRGNSIYAIDKLKTIISGDAVEVAKKYGQPFTLKSRATHIFGANNFPSMEVDQGMARRIKICLFEKRFNDMEVSNFNLDNILTPSAMNYLGTQSLIAYKEKLIRGYWSNESESKRLTKEQSGRMDTIIDFINEDYQDIDNVSNKEEVDFVYQTYVKYCNNWGEEAKGKRAFMNKLRDLGFIIDRVYKDGGPKYIVKFVPEDMRGKEKWID
jgi:putative DNA primase/helicase